MSNLHQRHNSESNLIDNKIDIPEGSALKPIKQGQSKDLRNEFGHMVTLIILYCLQGVPMGLSGGAMPFLLQSKASYTSIGVFSIASYPYSFKLLWSPIVDSVFWTSVGRRKSWIIPIQCLSGVLMIFLADFANLCLMEARIVELTCLFFALVLLAATQDIAVDGWALTLLSKENVGYASICQTIGMNIGYFSSFTVFLALNDPDFCNRYLRETPSEVGVLTLSSYIRFWGCIYFLVTLLLLMIKESKGGEQLSRPIKKKWYADVLSAYQQLWRVLKLPSIQKLSAVLVTYRLGVLVAESAGPLKLLEKGVSKEVLAGLVLVEFPLELVSAVLAGRWAATSNPLAPWTFGYFARFILAASVTFLIGAFPTGAAHLSDHPYEFSILALLGAGTSFSSTLMFTSLGSFFNTISDPEMGGAYLTLLNTVANIGIILPKVVLYWLMDVFTVRHCISQDGERWDLSCPTKKMEAEGQNPCTEAGAACQIMTDGFYILSYAGVVVGFALGIWYIWLLPRLQSLPASSWHAKRQSKSL